MMTVNNRLKRIQEVREQERSISRQQVSRYRSELNESKNKRLQQSKEDKLFQLERTQQELIIEWQRALLENGRAHTILERENQKTESTSRSSVDEKIRFQRALKMEREKREKDSQRTDNMKRMKIEVTRDFHKNAREEARAYAEKVNSSLKSRTEKQIESPHKKENFRIHVTEETIVNRNRKNVPVKATIIRHFDAHAHDDAVMVKNDASIAAQEIYRRLWGNVMQELLNRRTKRLRGRKASQQMLSMSNSPAGVAHLERHLHMLEMLNKQRRIKSFPSQSETNRLRLRKQKVAESIEMDFEEQFLSSSRQWNMESNTDPLPRPFVVHGLISDLDSAARMSTASIFEDVDQTSLRSHEDWRNPNPVRSNYNRLINVNDFPSQQFIPWRNVPLHPDNTTSLLLSPSSPSTSEEELSSGSSSTISAAAVAEHVPLPQGVTGRDDVRPTISSALPESPAEVDSRLRETEVIRTVNVPTVKADTSFTSVLSDEIQFGRSAHKHSSVAATREVVSNQREPNPMMPAPPNRAGGRLDAATTLRESQGINEETSEFDQRFSTASSQIVTVHRDDNLDEENQLQQQMELLRSKKRSQGMRESRTTTQPAQKPHPQPPSQIPLKEQGRESIEPAHDAFPQSRIPKKDRLDTPSLSSSNAKKQTYGKQPQEHDSNHSHSGLIDKGKTSTRKGGMDKLHDTTLQAYRSLPGNRNSRGGSQERDNAADAAAVAAAHAFSTSLESNGARREHRPQKGSDGKSDVATSWPQIPVAKGDESEVMPDDKSEDLDLSATFQSSSSSNLSADGYDRYFNDAIQSVRHTAIMETSTTNRIRSNATILNHEATLPNRSPGKSVIEREKRGNIHPQVVAADPLHGNSSSVSLTSTSRVQSQSDRSGRDPSAEAVAAAHAFSTSVGNRERNAHDRKAIPSENYPLLGDSDRAVSQLSPSQSILYKKRDDSIRTAPLSAISKASVEDQDMSGVSHNNSYSSGSGSSSSSSSLSFHGYDRYFNDTIQSVSQSATAGTLHMGRNYSITSYPYHKPSASNHFSLNKGVIERESFEFKNSHNRTNENLRSSTDNNLDESGVSIMVTSRRHTQRETGGRDPFSKAVVAAHGFSLSMDEGVRRERKGEDGRLIPADNRPLHHDSDGAASQLYSKLNNPDLRSAITTENDQDLDLSGVSYSTRSNNIIVGGQDNDDFNGTIQNIRQTTTTDISSTSRHRSNAAAPNLSPEKSGIRNPRNETIHTLGGSTSNDKADRSEFSRTITSRRNHSAEAVAAAHTLSKSLGKARRPKDERVILVESNGRNTPAPDKNPVRGLSDRVKSHDSNISVGSEDGSLELDLSGTFSSNSVISSNLSIESYDRYLKEAVQSIENRTTRTDALRVANQDHVISLSGDSRLKATFPNYEDREVSAVKVPSSKQQHKEQPLHGMDTSITSESSFIETSNSEITAISSENKYDKETKNPPLVYESSLVRHREGNKSIVITTEEDTTHQKAIDNTSTSGDRSPRRRQEQPNQSVDSIVSSTSGSISSDSIATDRLLQQWEDLFATRKASNQNPESENSRILLADSPKTKIGRPIDPPVSTHSSFSSDKDIKIVLNNESEYNNWSVSRSGFVHKYSESEIIASESASKSASADIFSSSKDSDSTAELLRQWNDLYSTSRVSDRRDAILTDEHRVLSMESTVFKTMKELQPPNPPSIPTSPVDDTFNHSFHSESIKPILSSSWNSSVGSDFLLESDSAKKYQVKPITDKASTELSKQVSLQYSDDSSRNVTSQVGVRDSSGSVSSSTAAERSLYEQWNTLYSSRMSQSVVNNVQILHSNKRNDTFRNDFHSNTVSSDILFGSSSPDNHHMKEEKSSIRKLKDAENLSLHRSPAISSSTVWDISDSSSKATVSVTAISSKISSDILSPVKVEGTPVPVAKNLSTYSFLGSESNILSSKAPSVEDRQSSDQGNVTDDVSITDLLKRWQDRRASSETLVDIPGRQYGVNNIITREGEGIFSSLRAALRADKTKPPLPRFDDSLLSSTVDNEDDYHLDDLSLSATLQLSVSKLQGNTTSQVNNSPSQIDSKDAIMSSELPVRFDATSDNVSLRTFRSTKIETTNGNSFSQDVDSMSAESDSDRASSSGRATTILFDASLMSTSDVDRTHTKNNNMSSHPNVALNDLLAGYTSNASIADLNSSFSLSNALSRLPLHLQDLHDRMNASQSSLVVPSDLSSDFSDEPTPALQIDLGESSDSLSASFKVGADVTHTSLQTSSSSSIDMGIRWKALGTVDTVHRTEKSTHSSIDLSSRHDSSENFDVDATEIHHAILDMRGKLLSTLAATTETPIQLHNVSMDRSANLSAQMEGLSVSELIEQDGNDEDVCEDDDHRATSVQFRSYQSIPTTSRGSATFIDGTSAIHAFENANYDVLLGLQSSKTSEPNSDSDVEPPIRSVPSPLSPSFSSIVSQENTPSGTSVQTFAPVSYMHRFLSGPKSSAANPTPSLSVRQVSNEAPSSDSESDSRRSRGTTSMSLSGSISNLSTYPLRGSSPSLSSRLRHGNPNSPTTDIVTNFSVSSDRGVAEDEAVPIDSIHDDDDDDETVIGYLARSVRM